VQAAALAFNRRRLPGDRYDVPSPEA